MSPFVIAIALAVVLVLLVIVGLATRRRSCKTAGAPQTKVWTKIHA